MARPELYVAWVKSTSRSRASVLEMPAKATSSVPARTRESSSLSVWREKRLATPNSRATASQSAASKPTSRVPLLETNGGKSA